MTREGGRYIVPENGGDPVKAEDTTADATPAPAPEKPAEGDDARPQRKKG